MSRPEGAPRKYTIPRDAIPCRPRSLLISIMPTHLLTALRIPRAVGTPRPLQERPRNRVAVTRQPPGLRGGSIPDYPAGVVR